MAATRAPRVRSQIPERMRRGALELRRPNASDRAGKTILQTIEQNPLLVAGVGLLVGGLIASALPRSEFEDELIGDTSSAAKRQSKLPHRKDSTPRKTVSRRNLR